MGFGGPIGVEGCRGIGFLEMLKEASGSKCAWIGAARPIEMPMVCLYRARVVVLG